MKITVAITSAELMDRGLWRQACDMLGLGEWNVNEGQMTSDSPILLSESQACRLGLVPSRPGMESEKI
jgi:hypothetical protein